MPTFWALRFTVHRRSEVRWQFADLKPPQGVIIPAKIIWQFIEPSLSLVLSDKLDDETHKMHHSTKQLRAVPNS